MRKTKREGVREEERVREKGLVKKLIRLEEKDIKV